MILDLRFFFFCVYFFFVLLNLGFFEGYSSFSLGNWVCLARICALFNYFLSIIIFLQIIHVTLGAIGFLYTRFVLYFVVVI